MAKPRQAKKCVAIAKDVLLQLRLGKYNPEQMTYLDGLNLTTSDKGDLRTYLRKEKPTCTVCGIGAMFISAVRKFDDFNIEQFKPLEEYSFSPPSRPTNDGDRLMRHLHKFFTDKEVRSIEHVFERWAANGKATSITDHPSAHKRLRLIAKEIIRQNGHFNIDKIK